ncbi:hypothetical protein BDF20DRAFT_889679 [Mycotypha africana]|uniref:uncharacterized protein n=1 Tax=Mycotypha africana TaxID=64632 RepID=UPI002301DE64|nr:uncharacterized protein BDF20DRAFT_889679 [Mycotypha africana]KAI8970164.1 hypothetical protein BDF20DRAFT_889679 [Mycotypha africana]
MDNNMDAEELRKKYESMSLDEMLVESNRQIEEVCKETPSIVHHRRAIIKQQQQLQQQETQIKPQEEQEEDRLLQLLNTAVSNNDIHKLEEIVPTISSKDKELLNVKDKDGTSPLIYAACFGKCKIVKLLIEAGADINIQDKLGWTALMWAINNHHEDIAKLLLDHGASSETKSANGRTVIDFVNHSSNREDFIDLIITRDVWDDDFKISRSISTTSQSSNISSSSSNSSNSSSSISTSATTITTKANIHIAAVEDDVSFHTSQYDNDVISGYHHNKHAYSLQQHDDINCINDDDMNVFTFQWDKCLPDQMFVFNSDDLDFILDTITSHRICSSSNINSKDITIPANIVFLASRFAHYFSTNELLDKIFDGFIDRIGTIIKATHRNVHTLAYWLTNSTRLLFYLKKDIGLVVATASQQLNLSELIHEIYTIIIYDMTENSLSRLIVPALLECEQITGMDHVEFTDSRYRFFRKSTSSISNNENSRNNSSSNNPQMITQLLSSLLSILQSFDVHQQIVNQIITQCFYYISCTLFNQVLNNKKLLCRSRAIQIRLNLSHIEEWISNHHYQHLLNHLLSPTIHLLQLLQCLTQLRDLAEFIKATKDMDTLNLSQIKRVVLNYRYEVNEPKLPEEIVKYTIQCVEDTVKFKQKKSMEAASIAVTQKSFTSVDNVSIVASTTSTRNSMCTINDMEDEDNDEEDVNEEFKDAQYMLPFSIPTLNHLYNSDDAIAPYIPQAWLDKLDNKQSDNLAAINTTTALEVAIH